MESKYHIVFVHIGESLPHYIPEALRQARLFNRGNIFLIANAETLENPCFNALSDITYASCESLGISPKHREFLGVSRLDRQFRNGFWLRTTERFYYIETLMKKYRLDHVFHLENDNLLYVDLEEILSIFIKNYSGIGATFDDDDRCVPGFMYIKDYKSMEKLTRLINHVSIQTDIQYNDMQLLAMLRKTLGSGAIDTLPIVPSNHPRPLESLSARRPENERAYYNHIDEFRSIFDAAAIGQYLGGIDPANSGERDTAGFINETCIFNPSDFRFEWFTDSANRRIPFMISGREIFRINNLHLHCKNLRRFLS